MATKIRRGSAAFALDFGLPLDALKSTLRACLAEAPHEENDIVAATTRRGKSIRCRVSCMGFASAPGVRGVVMFMEETA